MNKEQVKTKLKNHMLFVKCRCGRLYRLKHRFVVLPEAKHICPDCKTNVVEDGTLAPFDEAYEQKSTRLLPQDVRLVGKGIHRTYEADDPRLLE